MGNIFGKYLFVALEHGDLGGCGAWVDGKYFI